MKDTRWLALGIVVGLAGPLSAQDEDAAISRKRLALMEQTIASFVVTSDQLPDARLKLPRVPVMRYSDPTRGTTEENVLIDATVWRIGAEGRPTGLVTLEIYRATAETGILAYEFSSFVPDRFSLASKTAAAVVWEPAGPALPPGPAPGAP